MEKKTLQAPHTRKQSLAEHIQCKHQRCRLACRTVLYIPISAVSEDRSRSMDRDVTNLRLLQAAQAVFCFLGEPPGAEEENDLLERDPDVEAVSTVRVAGMVVVARDV